MYGTRNSTCSLNGPSNFSRVMMLPALGTTSIAPPSASFHAGGLLPSALTHLSRLLPSNRTTAPAGGGSPLASTLSSGLRIFRSPISPYWARAYSAAARPSRHVNIFASDRMVQSSLRDRRFPIADGQRCYTELFFIF